MIILEILEGTGKGRGVDTEEQAVKVGRDVKNQLPIDDIHVSTVHGEFRRDGRKWVYEDLKSTNGSAVIRGDEKITLSADSGQFVSEIQEGDLVLIGSARQPVVIGVSFSKRFTREEVGTALTAVVRIRDVDKFQATIGGDIGSLNLLYRVLCKLKWELDLNEVMASVQTAVFELLPKATHLCLAMYDPPSRKFVQMLCSERDRGKTRETFQISQTIINKVLEEKGAVLVANAPEEVGETESIVGAQILSTMATPLWIGDEITGLLQVDNRESPKIFRQDDLRLFLLFAAQISLALQNAVLFEKLQVAEKKLEGENYYLKGEEEKKRLGFVQCASKAMKEVYEKAQKVRDTKVSILIEGETGTGKEIVASMIHYNSVRKDKLFVAINCAAMPETLLESELFGHKKGSFTGADRDKKGLFETADGGTLFLDEVTEMPLSVQGKLLRVLQDSEVRPVGASASKKVDVRVVAASNRNIQKEVSEGRFREDLYYRLNVFPIRVPSLRERREDIDQLCSFFLRKYSQEFGKTVGGISQTAQDALKTYDWPGNIRELENEIQRMVLVVDAEQIMSMEHLSSHIRRVEKLIEEVAPESGTLRSRMEEVEKWILVGALKENGGNKSMTARALSISREGLHKKLSKYGL
ncbi:MAG: sigma 54-interacting transcriptional regulator [Pseudomonadota bacterium]